METFHRQLAMIAFGAGDELGLVLAGGYAISAHDLPDRQIADIRRWALDWASDLRARTHRSRPGGSRSEPDWDAYLDE